MKYYEVELTITPCTQDAQDLLSALTADAGFETFEETDTGLKAYAQQSLFDSSALEAAIAGFPIQGTHIIYKVREAEDRDWNEQWEQEGFEPISIPLPSSRGKGELVIHDGRHLPAPMEAGQGDRLAIEIDAHMAFGTGTHETTQMLCATLLDMELEGKRVLDCGCGTGILGICALKLGARECVGYDIDEWSTDNTRHNAVINQVDDRLQSLCGDATLLDAFDTQFDVVLANINRNILLQDMERFVSVMAPDSTLLLSGFYEDDCPLLQSKAQSLGLQLAAVRTNGDWASIRFERHS